MTTVDEFADARYLDPGDVRVTIATLTDLHDDDLPDWVIDEVDEILNPWCIRTVPQLWTGHRIRTDGQCRCVAMGGMEHAAGPDCPPPATPEISPR